MVFFICEVCNESLKKNKVETHSNTCRNCWIFSCLDCGKHFEGQDYRAHTSCISESQKYEGKFFVAKENKGDVKQQAWLEGVQRRLESAAGKSGLQSFVERLLQYDNLPRKRTKFVNFAKNSLNLKADPKGIADQLWEIVKPEEDAVASVQAAPAAAQKAEPADSQDAAASTAQAPAAAESKPVKQAANGSQRKPGVDETSTASVEEVGKKKKRKAPDEARVEPASGVKINKQLQKEEAKVQLAAGETAKADKEKKVKECTQSDAAGGDAAKAIKWKKIITKELKSVGGSMSLKKLRAEAVAEAKAHPTHENRTKADIAADFDREFAERIKNFSKFKFDGNIISLA
mmetsp:Transcript_38348/g.80574  ORF Transcript_38348/g.80574 Transcript_38348/m.80574 type:complete len:346 (-) Transcript_38348:395-1432(-)